VYGIEGLVNPRGFVIINPDQQNPKYPNIFSVGVCVAIPPAEPTPVPTGVPKTGFMIESMVAATARNIRALLDNKEPAHEATWNAVCLADFGDSGVGIRSHSPNSAKERQLVLQRKTYSSGKSRF